VDEGKLKWDDPVIDHLEWFQVYDPYVSHEITIRDLLTHRSGMGLGEGDLLFFPPSSYSRDEILHRLRFMKPASSLRSHYAYDILLYLAAGQIIPTVCGQQWEDFIRDRIFRPLGMTDSNTTVAAYHTGDNYATPHSEVEGSQRAPGQGAARVSWAQAGRTHRGPAGPCVSTGIGRHVQFSDLPHPG
jgi:CubicO group peptidase (beta-lactamase class C family)